MSLTFHSCLVDRKIDGINFSVEFEMHEYLALADRILGKNEFQRDKSNKKLYSLLKKDLKDGCVMPPVTLALSSEMSAEHSELIQRCIQSGLAETDVDALRKVVASAVENGELLILDGLQRSLTLIDCAEELRNETESEYFYQNRVRTEIYIGLNKTGVLYRMLTLNTGQTPMSFRHQIEIMYHDYVNSKKLKQDHGITVVKQKENSRARGKGSYRYSDVVDLFYCFATGKPSGLERQDALTQLAELNFADGFKIGHKDEMMQILLAYNGFVRLVNSKAADWQFSNDAVHDPFAKNVSGLFQKRQPMTAFGTEAYRLIKDTKRANFKTIDDLCKAIDDIEFTDTQKSLDELISFLAQVRAKGKNIGARQREFFQLSFRSLLNSDDDAYLDFGSCWERGYDRFVSLN